MYEFFRLIFKSIIAIMLHDTVRKYYGLSISRFLDTVIGAFLLKLTFAYTVTIYL
jgi:hypothetical protein